MSIYDKASLVLIPSGVILLSQGQLLQQGLMQMVI